MRPTSIRSSSLLLAAALVLPVTLGAAACGGESSSAPDGKTPITAPPESTDTSDEPVPTLRLPADVHPVKEKLDLTIDPNADGFSGTAEIDVVLDRPRDGVWLHARDLRITQVKARRDDKSDDKAKLDARWEIKDPSGVGRVVLPKRLPPGPLHLSLAFEGKWSTGSKGLYLSTQDGARYVYSQFEDIDARRAFPCFDEPAAKIPFEVALTVPSNAVAIANGPEVSRTNKGTNVRVQFAPTPPIPSYLVAFAVGPFDVVNAPPVPPNDARPKPLPLRLIAAKGHGAEMAYAVAHSGEIVGTLEKYLGVAYPYDKLDLIDAPDATSSMENAGAIMFARSRLRVNEKTSPMTALREYAEVLTHELAHQWFGDLVTAEWWDDVWLNESLATWMAAKASDAWNPRSEGQLALEVGMNRAMDADARASARAIRQPIRTNDDITNAFDDITYEKGGGVLAMFERFVGAPAFQKGIHTYLEAHRFKNATAADFTQAISQAAGRDVDAAMRTFLDAPGVPLLEVQTLCDGVPRLHVKQSRYVPNGSSATNDQTWKVPFCSRYGVGGKSQESCMLLESQEADVPLEGGSCPSWVMPNADGAGYYRFVLPPADMAKLRGPAFAQMGARERLAYATALRTAERRGTLEYADLIADTAPLLKDTHEEVVSEAMYPYREARDWLVGTPLQPKVEARARDAFRSLARDLGMPKPGEDPDRAELRKSVLTFLLDTGLDAATRTTFAKPGAALVAGGKPHLEAVDPSLVGVALESYVAAGSAAEWNNVSGLLTSVSDDVTRREMVYALAATLDPALRESTRGLALDPKLRDNEVFRPLYYQVRRPELRDPLWQWAKANYDALMKRVGNEEFGGLTFLELPNSFCDEAHALDVERFFAPKIGQLAGGPRALAETVESIRLCATRRDTEEKQVRAYYEGKPSPSRESTMRAAAEDTSTNTPHR